MDDLMQNIPNEENVLIDGDLIEHIGSDRQVMRMFIEVLVLVAEMRWGKAS